MERIMALDAGDKRIGVAVSDPMHITAQGLKVLENSPGVLAEIADLCKEYAVGKIVVGLPKNMNNSLGPRADWALKFAEQVSETTGLSVVMEDERLTTVAANRVMLEADLSRRKRRKVIDKMAAVLILQNYLSRGEKNDG
ncbi:MAG: Holliday junction resolvase RuvX [Eubacteriales bacterium]|jgi:putative Holliday junction resolvase|nr:Holliday junction resolvase RuvX [Eubacteriales bacterium]MDD4769356.1 Holliday junction resolvase RuvX [Eubacteriales bacterium]